MPEFAHSNAETPLSVFLFHRILFFNHIANLQYFILNQGLNDGIEKKVNFICNFIVEKFAYSRIITTFAVSNKNKVMNKYKAKEVIRMLEEDGWILDRTRGSHRQFKHPTKPGTVTVNGKPNQVLEQFILNSIWKQAGWK